MVLQIFFECPLVILSVDCEAITLKVANNLKSLTSTTTQELKL